MPLTLLDVESQSALHHVDRRRPALWPLKVTVMVPVTPAWRRKGQGELRGDRILNAGAFDPVDGNRDASPFRLVGNPLLLFCRLETVVTLAIPFQQH